MALANLMSLNWLVPGVAMKIDNSRAVRGLRGMPRQLLLFVHGLVSGTAPSLEPLLVLTEAEARAAMGEGSMGFLMWQFARHTAGKDIPIHIMSVPEPGSGQAATGTITVTTAANKAGVLFLYVGGIRLQVGVSPDDGVNDIASAIVVAINAEKRLPVTATASTGVVTVTCRHKGEIGNGIDIRTNYHQGEALPQGMALTITPMSSGSGNPDLIDALAALVNERYTEVVNPFSDAANLRLIEDDMARRWQHDNMQSFGMATCFTGTVGELGTLADRVGHQCGHTVGINGSPTPFWCIAASMAGVVETGAAIDPAVPHSRKELIGVLAPKPTEVFEDIQRNVLLAQGISTVTVNSGRVYIDRLVTNYTENAVGVDDMSYRNLCWVKTLEYWRFYNVTEYQLKYFDWKMGAKAKPVPGQKIMTAQIGEEIQLSHYQTFIDAGLMQDMEGYADELLVEVNDTHGRLKVQDAPRLITQHYQTEITSQYLAGASS